MLRCRRLWRCVIANFGNLYVGSENPVENLVAGPECETLTSVTIASMYLGLPGHGCNPASCETCKTCMGAQDVRNYLQTCTARQSSMSSTRFAGLALPQARVLPRLEACPRRVDCCLCVLLLPHGRCLWLRCTCGNVRTTFDVISCSNRCSKQQKCAHHGRLARGPAPQVAGVRGMDIEC